MLLITVSVYLLLFIVFRKNGRRIYEVDLKPFWRMHCEHCQSLGCSIFTYLLLSDARK